MTSRPTGKITTSAIDIFSGFDHGEIPGRPIDKDKCPKTEPAVKNRNVP